MIADLVHPALLAASKSKPSSSSSGIFWIFLLVIGVAAYFLWLRPQQQRQRKQRQMQSDIHEGDEVVTVGGIVGRVIEMKDDRVHLLTGYHTTDGTTEHLPQRMTFVRNAISRKVEPPAGEPVTNGSGALDDFSFEHDADGHEPEDGVAEGATWAEDGSEDGAGDAGSDEPAGGDTGTAEGGPGRRGRGRRAGGGAKGGTSP